MSMWSQKEKARAARHDAARLRSLTALEAERAFRRDTTRQMALEEDRKMMATHEKDLSYLPPGVLEFLRSKGCEPLGRGEMADENTRGWWVGRYDIDSAFADRAQGWSAAPCQWGAGEYSGFEDVLVLWRPGAAKAEMPVAVTEAWRVTSLSGVPVPPEESVDKALRRAEHFRPIVSTRSQRTTAAIQAIAALVEQLPPPVDMNAERDKAWRAAKAALREAVAALEEE